MWSMRRPCRRPSAIRRADQAMGGIEGARVLDANAGEIVDVEEAPVVDLAAGDAPERDAIVLALQQAVQRDHRRRDRQARLIGDEPARDDVGATGHRRERGLEASALSRGTASRGSG